MNGQRVLGKRCDSLCFRATNHSLPFAQDRNALLSGVSGCLWLCPPVGMELLVLSHHGVVMALGFLSLSLKCRAEGCPTVHLPGTNSSDTGCPLLLHLDVALSINPTFVMHNIFKTKNV